MLDSFMNMFSIPSLTPATTTQQRNLDILFRPIGSINNGVLVSFSFGYYDNIEYYGRQGDTLVFIHTQYMVSPGEVIPDALKMCRWPMSTFDTQGVKNIRLIKEEIRSIRS